MKNPFIFFAFAVHWPLVGCGEISFDHAINPVAATEFREDFENQTLGELPDPWFSTGEQSRLELNPGTFAVEAFENNRVLATSRDDLDVHAHIGVDVLPADSNYELSGRMRLDEGGRLSGIGVTLVSDYPRADSYHRIRAIDFGKMDPIKIVARPHPDQAPDSKCQGIATEQLSFEYNRWFWFRIQTRTLSDRTTLLARVWPDNSPEPDTWRIDCNHAGQDRPRRGTIGVWASGPGHKYWDDLTLRHLETR